MYALVLAALLSGAPAGAAAPTPARLRWNPRVEVPVTGALVASWALTEFAFKPQLAPQGCRWCATNGFDTGVRRLFNPTLAPSANGVGGPDLASNLVGFVALPVALLSIDALLAWRSGELAEAFPLDVTAILEATFTGLLLCQAVKFSVGRARPYTIGAAPELLATAPDRNDHDVSFFSGHTTLAFGLVTSAGTVAMLRGRKYAWVTWAVGVPLATTTALLRLAADKHWATDILVGLLVGVGAGVGVPLLLHGTEDAPAVRVSLMPSGVMISGRF